MQTQSEMDEAIELSNKLFLWGRDHAREISALVPAISSIIQRLEERPETLKTPEKSYGMPQEKSLPRSEK